MTSDNNTKSLDEYIFRFKITHKEQELNPDTVLFEFYKQQIADLFKIIFFSKNGEKIIPNEFGFLNEPDKKYPLWEGPDNSSASPFSGG